MELPNKDQVQRSFEGKLRNCFAFKTPLFEKDQFKELY